MSDDAAAGAAGLIGGVIILGIIGYIIECIINFLEKFFFVILGGIGIIAFIGFLIFLIAKYNENPERFKAYFSRNGKRIVVISVISIIGITNLVFKQNKELAYKYAPIFLDDSTKLDFQIDDLKELRNTLENKISKLSSLKSSISSDLDSNISMYNNEFYENTKRENALKLAKQLKADIRKIEKQEVAIHKALNEIEYMISFGQNNLRMLDSDSDRKEIIKKINSLKSRASDISHFWEVRNVGEV